MNEMTRRDTLAAAVAGQIWAHYQTDDARACPEWRHQAALEAYLMADAMIDVRSAQPVETEPPALTPQQWQPIETAPKDGTWILAINAAKNPGRQHVVHYSERWGNHYPWVTGSAPMDFVAGVTHWMPLPPEPKT